MAAAAINIEDWREAARRYLPRLAFDYIEGGAEDEIGIARNELAFQAARIVPRYLIDIATRETSAVLFGKTYRAPLGIAPMGMTGLFRNGNDLAMARAAHTRCLPFVLSASGNATIEETAKAAPGSVWLQIYGTKDRAVTEDQLRRAIAAGLDTLVLTVDVPVSAKRERNYRNGFARPLRLSRKSILNLMLHPRWTLDYLARGGLPVMGNFAPYAPTNASANQVADFFAEQTPAADQTWRDVERYRKLWPGSFVIKGILHPDDAIAAVRVGANGIIVSNHGGRQLDRAPASIEMLPAIKAVVGENVAVMLDSGVRRGSDIAVALALGARFVFCGRAALYAAVAGGENGAANALDILVAELKTVMGQAGCQTLSDFDASRLLIPGESGLQASLMDR